jgi:hypothetical protein
MRRIRPQIIGMVCALSLSVAPADAADKPQIFVLNVVVQGAVTVASAAVRGHVKGPRDIVRTFVTGSASGAGLYEAKALVGRGHSTAGWLMANATGSLSENASAGRHPLAQIGYSIGPARFRFSIPRFDRTSDAHVHVDVSAFETLALATAIAVHERAGFRGGMLVFRRDTPYDGYTFEDTPLGGTVGIFPGAFENSEYVWNHEMVHAVQGLQADILDPPVGFLTRDAARTGSPKRQIHFGSVMVGFTAGVAVLSSTIRPYVSQWTEVEAYRLANDRAPFTR